ncbi:MAG: RrF2 family transcriptional regulator [Candidatus Aminicenantes bacterium]
MIKLSTKGRYGTRLMLNLAQHYNNGNEAIILRSVSEEEDISIRYLEQIIIPLKISKLVKSIRGAGGGYTLARPPAEIKLSDILHSLEGSCCLVDCVDDPDYCDRIPICGPYEVWKEASDRLKNYFENVSLQDLIKISEKKRPKSKS